MPAIPYTRAATTDAVWCPNGDDVREDEANLRAAFAWVDPAGDPAKRSSYKFPYRFLGNDGAAADVATEGCLATISLLNSGKRSLLIPEADRIAVFEAIAGHLRAAQKPVPRLKTIEAIDGEIETVMRTIARGEMGPVYDERWLADTEQLFRSMPDKPAESRWITGHPAVFNSPADLGYFTERVMPGAFTRTITEDDPAALFNHNNDLIVGRVSSGTLILTEDTRGLRSDIDVAPNGAGNDLMVSMQRGDVKKGSIGFIARKQKVYKQDGLWMRDLTDCKLFDVSPVVFPAYDQTDYAMRRRPDLFTQALTSFRNGPEGRSFEDPKQFVDAIAKDDAWRVDFERRKRAVQLAEL